MATAGGHGQNEWFASRQDSFVSRRSHFQRWTKNAQGAPVPLRAIETVSCAATVTNKHFLLHGVVLHDAAIPGGTVL